MFSCVDSFSVVQYTSSMSRDGEMPSALPWTPLCGVSPLPHGSTVAPDPIGTRRWSGPTVSCPQSVSQHSAVGADACGVAPLSASSYSFPFSTPVASATFPSDIYIGSYVTFTGCKTVACRHVKIVSLRNLG